MKLLKILITCISLTLIIGCQKTEENKKMESPKIVEIAFKESFESFKERYPSVKVEHQPIGANFYEFGWPEKMPGVIRFNMDGDHFDFPNAIHFLMMEVISESNRGITKFSFKSGITYDKKISHDVARLKFHDFLRSLLDKGWKRTISFSDPRLSGSQAAHYMREHENFYSLDPDYLPTLKEWMAVDKLTSMFWGLQADNKAFMSIDLQRKFDKTNPDIGVYLLSISIVNDQEKGRLQFAPEKKLDWNDLKKWEAVQSNLLKIRAKREKDLLSKGYKIDESYEDYEITPKKEP